MTGRLLCLGMVVISCCARQVQIPIQRSQHKQESCYAELEIGRQSCYQKEPIPFVCYFYAPRDQVANANIAWHENCKHLYVYPQPHITESDNVRMWTWSGVWYPQSVDDNVFPYLYINFERERRRKGRSGMLGSLWGGFAREQKQIMVRGSGQPITVISLPQDTQIDGVGTFGSCSWTGIPEQITVGKSYEIRLRLSGSGNLPYIAPPDCNVENGVRWFYVGDEMEHPVHAYQRTYVYALYVTQPGEYTVDVLPWQMFDPQSESVYTCKPEQLTFTAYGNAMHTDAAEETQMPETSDDTPSEQEEEDTPGRLRYMMIPVRWFFGLVFVPIVIGTGSVGWQVWCRYAESTYLQRRVKRSFRHADRVIRRRDSSAYQIYCACTQVFQSLAQYTGIHEHIIESHVMQYSPDNIEDWRHVWHVIETCAFQQNKESMDVATRNKIQQWMRMLYARWKSQLS